MSKRVNWRDGDISDAGVVLERLLHHALAEQAKILHEDDFLRGFQISVSDLRFLIMIETKGEQGVTAVADALRISNPAGVMKGQNLRRRGLIQDVDLPSAGQRKPITLTDRGREVLVAWKKGRISLMVETTTTFFLRETDQEIFLRLLLRQGGLVREGRKWVSKRRKA